MIDNSLESLRGEFKIKSKVLMTICNKLKLRISPFETKRSLTRQKWLMAQGKSWTLKSKHLDGLAVDWVFTLPNGQPSWVGKYPSVHFIGAMCGCVPIYKNGRLIESCHLQDDWKSIAVVMKNNSARYMKESAKNQELLKLVNDCFRTYWYK